LCAPVDAELLLQVCSSSFGTSVGLPTICNFRIRTFVERRSEFRFLARLRNEAKFSLRKLSRSEVLSTPNVSLLALILPGKQDVGRLFTAVCFVCFHGTIIPDRYFVCTSPLLEALLFDNTCRAGVRRSHGWCAILAPELVCPAMLT
jgi:hypothetical protein